MAKAAFGLGERERWSKPLRVSQLPRCAHVWRSRHTRKCRGYLKNSRDPRKVEILRTMCYA